MGSVRRVVLPQTDMAEKEHREGFSQRLYAGALTDMNHPDQIGRAHV